MLKSNHRSHNFALLAMLVFALLGGAAPSTPATAQGITAKSPIPVGAPIYRNEVPFGTIEAYDVKAVYRSDVGAVITRWKPGFKGAVVFVKPPSGNGWAQKVTSVRVYQDKVRLSTDSNSERFGRPFYSVPVDAKSGEFYAIIEATIFIRSITEDMRNPNPIRLSAAEIKKYTGDYTYVPGIASGEHRETLKQLGLIKRPEETTWQFVRHAMQESKPRWSYQLGRAPFFKDPTDWFKQKNIGNCDNMSTYLCWLLRENGIPARQDVATYPADTPGGYSGHAIVEFYSSEQGCWVPADLTHYVGGVSIEDSIGKDSRSRRVKLLSTDDASYWIQNTSIAGNEFGIKYGTRPRFIEAGSISADNAGFGGSPVFESVIRRPIQN